MPNDEEIRITLRLSADLRDRLNASAAANNRSMNGEIVAALEDVYGRPGEIVTREQLPSMTFKVDELIGLINQIGADVRALKDEGKD